MLADADNKISFNFGNNLLATEDQPLICGHGTISIVINGGEDL